MSGEAELERTLRQLRRYQKKLSTLWRRYVIRFFRLRIIKGVLIGRHAGPISDAKVTLNGWRSVYTNRQGEFSFRFVFRSISHLSVEWREIELTDWIKVDASRRRIIELKLKWPPLIRGQIVTPDGAPISELSVILNGDQLTSTDAQGTFVFPLDDETDRVSDQLLFLHGGLSHVHHFKSKPEEHLLHRFILDAQGFLFHLEDRPAAQPHIPSIKLFAKRMWLSIWMISALLLISFLIIFSMSGEDEGFSLKSNDAHSRETFSTGWRNAGVLERSLRDGVDSDQRPPMWDETQEETDSLETEFIEDQTLQPCQDMEFTYSSYIVPRGMEGILLSIIFGRWQSWRGELSTFNGLDRHHQLQAGQRIKMKLPIHPWTRYLHKDDQSWKSLWRAGECDQESQKLCSQLLQAWNPHIVISNLKKGDELIVNLDLLKRHPFEGGALKRIEGLRRYPMKRYKRPRILMSKGCHLPQPPL